MNRFLYIFCLLLATSITTLSAQISEGGQPATFTDSHSLRSELAATVVPVNFSIEDLKAVDEWQASQGAPLRVATIIDTNLSIDNSGSWSTLDNGQSVWQLRIKAANAIAISLFYSHFYIPEGGKLFVYNSDHSQVIGAFTHKTNPKTEKYSTVFIAGDDICLEYDAPQASTDKPRITIEGVGYGYNFLTITKSDGDLRSSNSCEVNINCGEGDAWQKEKKGVCKMILRIGNSNYLCSGTLLNNTNEDLKPYILSASHCHESSANISTSEYAQWQFYFNYELSGCGNDSEPNAAKTMIGCAKMASTPMNGGSDGLLLLINGKIPESYDVYYNGWDSSSDAPASGVGIHHPAGDYKKISTYNTTATSATWSGESKKGQANAHWNVSFIKTINGFGLYEKGSSGSPLFNQDGNVIGSLSGGTASCASNIYNGANLYGKLYYHWDLYNSADSLRMDKYLDPSGKNIRKLEGRYYKGRKTPPTGLTLDFKKHILSLNWKAVDGDKPLEYRVYNNNVLVKKTSSLSYTEEEPDYGIHTYYVSAFYPDSLESTFTSTRTTIPEYKAPTNLFAYQKGEQVVLTWNKPIFYQQLYWGTHKNASTWSFGVDTLYFGQHWAPEDLAKLNNRPITSVQFAPTTGVNYSLLMFQGLNRYEQTLTNLTGGIENSITLDKPFVLDSISDLIVLIKYMCVPNPASTIYPIASDSGPAVEGKGNILSSDGNNWAAANIKNFTRNFFLSITVASDNLATKSSEATNFPSPNGYNIYCDDNLVATVSNPSTEIFYDKVRTAGRHVYSIEAIYGEETSYRSDARVSVTVTVDNTPTIDANRLAIVPTSFTDKVRIIGYEKCNLLEVYSSEGKLMKSVRPQDSLDTSAFPAGIYFFRFHSDDGIKTLKGIKRQ